MKSKTIKLILSNKLKSFITSIDDGVVRDLVKNNTIITGGSIVSMLMKESVNDYDLYFRNKETVIAVANYFLKKAPKKVSDRGTYQVHVSELGRVIIAINSNGKPIWTEARDNPAESTEDLLEVGDEIAASALEDEKEPKYEVSFISPNAITLTGKVQLILRFYGEVGDIHKNYDFVHCTSAWTSWDNNLWLNPAALESILSKELRYVGSLYPICSVVRLRKFIARGWSINAGQIFKMCYQISKLDLDNIPTLEDQMIGVDSSYFSHLIILLKEKNPNSEKVDQTYLMTLIDKVFN